MDNSDGITFTPGELAVVESPGFFSQKFSSVFAGYKTNQYVIIEHPVHNGRFVPLEDGIEIMIRFVENGVAYGFRSHILRISRLPFPLVYIEYPQRFESAVLRKEGRFPVELEAGICLFKSKDNPMGKLKGRILNLSRNGCLLRSPTPFDPESSLFISVPFPEFGRVEDLEVEVRGCRKSGSEYHVGLSFIDNLDTQWQTIEEYLERLESMQVRP